MAETFREPNPEKVAIDHDPGVTRRVALGVLGLGAAALSLSSCGSPTAGPGAAPTATSGTQASPSVSSKPAVAPSAPTAAAKPTAAPAKPAPTPTPKPAVTFPLWQIGNITFPAVLPASTTVATLLDPLNVGLDEGALAGALYRTTRKDVGIKPVLKNYWSGTGQQELLTDLAGNTNPAVYPAIGDDPSPYVHQNLAADLTPFTKTWPAWDKLPASLKTIATVGGRVYALPVDKARGYGVAYRVDLFKEAGIPTPSADWTIDQFVEICRKVADPAKKVWAISMLTSQWPSWYFDEWAQSFGVPLSLFPVPNQDGTNFAMAPVEELARVLKFYKDLVFTDKVALAGMGENYGTMMSDIVSGRTAMGVRQTVQMAPFFGHVGVPGFVQPSQIGLLPMPVGPEGLRNYDIGSNFYCIDSRLTGDALKRAWDLLTYFIGGPGEQLALMVTAAAGGIPPGPPIYEGIIEPPELSARVPAQWSQSSQIAVSVPIPPDPGRFGISGQHFSKVKDTIDPFVQAILVDPSADPLDQAKKMSDAVNAGLYSQPANGLNKDKWHAYYAELGKYFQKNYPKYYAGTYTTYYKRYESW